MPVTPTYNEEFAFYDQLRFYYEKNRGKIRSRYNDLTKKFLAYNDREENPSAFLRPPQFEALEMYVFIKEFMDNAQVYKMFDDWRNRQNNFSDASCYSRGQEELFDKLTVEQTEMLFKQMKKYRENYPNYIYALTMGLGKTVLMGTCIFYEFLLANKYPKDGRFCHNALVFAPDKTVLQSLREIMTFDKTKVVPPEYARVLDANIKFHFLDESSPLHTLDGSDFNIVISNTQKIIVKKKHKEDSATEKLFKAGSFKPENIQTNSLLSTVYGSADDEDVIEDDDALTTNQRFEKLLRLPQLGVYVDEAHHLFGKDLSKAIRSDGKTSLRDTVNMLAESQVVGDKRPRIVACYNYTGTPYIENQVLPEVVYAYGLKESIQQGFLKEADLKAFENVKNEEFLRTVLKMFWEKYGGKTYEGLPAKLAVFASTIEEAMTEVRPLVEKILAELDVSTSKILVNVGDPKYTKDEDIRLFNELDVVGTQGSEKQFIILVGKGREGWNCRSLFGVAMFRSPKSKVFVLQATMRCLRSITDEQQTATVFLSKENYETLDAELNKNFNMEIKDLSHKNDSPRSVYQVRVLPPPRTITLKHIRHKYSLEERGYHSSIDFELTKIDLSKYAAVIYEKDRISSALSVKERNIDEIRESRLFSVFTLAGEIAVYLNISPMLAEQILIESVDGKESILETVNKYNEIIFDAVIPKIFWTLYEVKCEKETENRELILLREPEGRGYYEFSAKDELVITKSKCGFQPAEVAKSFHADTYCFDSKPERECFLQYITSSKVAEVYFTGMFTSNQGDLSVQYYDPENKRIRQYYPDFLAKMTDGTYQLVEVKGDNKIDDVLVKAKADAARELAAASGVEYKMYAGSDVMKSNILNPPVASTQTGLIE